MRIAITAAAAATVALLAASTLGVAAAEAPTVTPARTVSVQGIATAPIEQGASAATATGIYHQGLANAVADGHAKAELLAGKAGATLGTVQDIAEGGGYINCTGGEEPNGAEYQGEQPDFGYSGVSVAPQSAAAAPARPPVVHKRVVKHGKPAKKGPTAKKASATSCTLSAQVTLVYTIS
jgi:hypothetical protein